MKKFRLIKHKLNIGTYLYSIESSVDVESNVWHIEGSTVNEDDAIKFYDDIVKYYNDNQIIETEVLKTNLL
jgi:hypothetical protein